MKYRLVHTTGYRYSEPASLSQNELCVTPRPTARLQVLASRLLIDPEPQYFQQQYDFYGNTVQVFMVQHPHDALTITATSTVATHKEETPAPEATLPWEQVAERVRQRATEEDFDASQFLFASPLVSILPEALAFARPSFPPHRPLLAGAVELVRRIYIGFSYDKSATSVDTPIEEVLLKRRGVCQDFSHLAISCLRSLGLAARYVSGYLETLPPPGKPKLVGCDASHAWISLYLPDWGWVDLDPTNNMLCGEGHIALAWGRDYGDVTPVKGVVMGGGIHTLTVSVEVERVQ
jgi:transglutaminase-like putative cysteine protease